MKIVTFRNIGVVSLSALLFVQAACSKADKPPKDLLSKDKMTEVLIDIQLAEASLNVKRMVGVDAAGYYSSQYGTVLKSHQVNRKEFENSFTYYTNHPKELDAIYSKVLEELSKKEAEAMTAHKK